MTRNDWIGIFSYILGCAFICSFVYGWANDITSKSNKYLLIMIGSAFGIFACLSALVTIAIF
jgi:hypothetical protein